MLAQQQRRRRRRGTRRVGLEGGKIGRSPKLRSAKDEMLVQEMARGVPDRKHASRVRVPVGRQLRPFREMQALHPPCERLVIALLRLAAAVQLLLLAGRAAAVEMQQAVVLDGGVVEPRAVAALPAGGAAHAELGPAPARHVVAALLQLDGGGAVEAALPAVRQGDGGELRRRRVVRGAGARAVPAPGARGAHFGLAARAAAVGAAGVATAGRGGRVWVDVGGLDPLAAAFGGAVEPVGGRVFLVFLVPLPLELEVEELVDVLQGDVLGGAAGGGHVRGVGDGQGEDAAEAGVAHAVAAGQFRGFGDRDVVGHASEALDPGCMLVGGTSDTRKRVSASSRFGWETYCASGLATFCPPNIEPRIFVGLSTFRDEVATVSASSRTGGKDGGSAAVRRTLRIEV